MSDLYTIIAGIQPDQQEILEAELLAKHVLETSYPDLDLREGTGLRDLVIRPSAFLLAICKKGIDFYFSQNTIDKVASDTSTEVVDDLLSNLFLSRNTGTYAVINARLYFGRPKTITLNTTMSFSTDGALLFFPAITATYPDSALLFDSFQNEWYLDVDLVAGERGPSYNIGSGSLLYFTNFDPYFLHGEINYLSSSSTAPESNADFIARAKSSISTRNLINIPSIESRLKADFNYLNRVKTIGAGQVETYRDQVKVRGGPIQSYYPSNMSLSDGDTLLVITQPGHSFLVGQRLDVVETGTSPTKLVLRNVSIVTVVSGDSYKVGLPVTIPSRSFFPPVVTLVEDDIFIHQGGMVDIYCSETLTKSLVQLTLDSTGKASVIGGHSMVRSSASGSGTADTVPFVTAYTTTFSGHVLESAVSFSQDGDGTITVLFKNHPMSLGRMVKIDGWPQTTSHLYYTVTSIVDQDHFKVGRDIDPLVVDSGLTPSLTYVYPAYDTGFSSLHSVTVDFGVGFANGTCSFFIDKFDNLDSIQSYLDLEENRVVCADYLARGYDTYLIDIILTSYGDTIPASGLASSLVAGFFSKLAPGQNFILSDLVAVLTSNGISMIKTPLGVTYKYYTKDMFPPKTGTVVDVLIPETSTSIYIINSVSSILDTL